jgi:phage I-like protein
MEIKFSDGTSVKMQDGTTIQSVILSKERFKTREEATKWIKENNFKADKIDEPKNEKTFRFRQREPDEFKDDGFGPDEKFNTITLTNGVKAIIGFLKETKMQENLQDSETHVHEFDDPQTEKIGRTGRNVEENGEHYHSIGSDRTSTDPDSPDHTHALPNGKKTGPPLAIKMEEDREEKEKKMSEPVNFEFYSDLSSIKFSEGKTEVWIEILKAVSNEKHPIYGDITITPQEIKNYKKNFEDNIRGKELPVDYFHENLKLAGGWIKELKLSEEGNLLLGLIDFTKKAREMIKEKEIKFFSPEFREKYISKTGKVIKNVLLGGGLTNRPFLDLSPIKLSENLQCCLVKNKEEELNMSELKELTEQNVKLSEQNSDLTVKFSEVSTKLTEIEAEKENLSTKLAEIEKESALVKFEAAFGKLLDEGKVVPAMKEKLQEKFNSEELVKFYEDLPQIIKFSESLGHSITDNSKGLTDIETKVSKEMGYSEDDIKKFGRK